MPRLFAALPLPPEIRTRLTLLQGGLPGARWTRPENFHITLRFIGEVDARTADDVASALDAVQAAPFDVVLKGCGVFGKDKPRSLWVGVAPNPDLNRLAAKIERACQTIGLPPDGRKFAPHVTLARINGVPPEKIRAYVEEHALFETPPFRVEAFGLYSSRLGQDGSTYTLEVSYPLTRTG